MTTMVLSQHILDFVNIQGKGVWRSKSLLVIEFIQFDLWQNTFGGHMKVNKAKLNFSTTSEVDFTEQILEKRNLLGAFRCLFYICSFVAGEKS